MTTKKAKRKTSETIHHSNTHPRDEKLEIVLVENFVALQKIMTNLSVRFENLSDRISKLLDLFEISAKALADKEFNIQSGNEKKYNDEFSKKLDDVLNQNKVIARGLSLLHENTIGKEIEFPSEMRREQQVPIPRRVNTQNPEPSSKVNMQGYQKSIFSEEGDKFP